MFSAVTNGFRTMRDTRGTIDVVSIGVEAVSAVGGVKAAGGGGSGNVSRYRAGSWWLR